MTMILHHHPLTAPSRFVRLCLSEYDVDVEFVEERPWERREEFTRMSPACTLPVLVSDNGSPIVGLYPVIEYLDETRGTMMRNKRLMPETPMDRAEVRRLIDWFANRLDTDVVRVLVRERVFKLEMPREAGGGAPDSSAMRAARSNIRQHMKYLDWLVSTRDWVAGAQLTAADMAAGASLSVLDYLGEVTWNDYPQARDWYSRLKSRPSFRPILADRVRALPPVSHYSDLDF